MCRQFFPHLMSLLMDARSLHMAQFCKLGIHGLERIDVQLRTASPNDGPSRAGEQAKSDQVLESPNQNGAHNDVRISYSVW